MGTRIVWRLLKDSEWQLHTNYQLVIMFVTLLRRCFMRWESTALSWHEWHSLETVYQAVGYNVYIYPVWNQGFYMLIWCGVIKYFWHRWDTNWWFFFVRSKYASTRGHHSPVQIIQEAPCFTHTGKLVSERIVNAWNILPDIVDFSSFSRFKRSIHNVDFSRFAFMICVLYFVNSVYFVHFLCFKATVRSLLSEPGESCLEFMFLVLHWPTVSMFLNK